ncbi:MAG: ATP synthase F0 subunit A [Deltaproteobacteria bacterium CG23_combo_of_CG06-09_8_20_14_all_60_8]|nr:MAG: ATP synthase F0 subunit A [Desulfobacterales bacterium CG2_30_60_27]PIP43997.1 MAG: ATP synthase F0 subunit A [Deltaproteobacteria bacterium CG23_combo_of_CG06-09_8_20_14_all_60_8]
MEHPILFISLILEKLGAPVPHGLVGDGWAEKLSSPHMTYTWLVMLLLILLPKLTLRHIELIPGKAQNFWETLIGGLESFMAENMGEEGARMMFPMLATFALYILVANMIGLLPGCMSPTSNLNITLGCTLVVFVTTHILGLRFHGVAYIKHFLGPIPWLMPLMFPIELISHLARILSLSIRLFGNIMAKETLLGILFMLAGAYFAPLPILCLGVFVSIVQALVFLLLSILYFSGAMEHAH